MGIKTSSLNRSVTAFLAAMTFALPVFAQENELDRLMDELAKPEQPGWRQIEDSILLEWAKSGSPAMDLLLRRGNDAFESGDVEAAVEHLTALTDHAPDFAEGWNARATVFFQMGEYGLSLEDIRRTLLLNPEHFGAMTGLAVIFEELGYEEEALEAWRAVEAIHPHRPELHEAIERLAMTVEGEHL
ncbi:tetratricopeptide repeat protein [Tropicimonas sp. TH_r6]|uniref:tetratricopeptide repeat protein n=1 Tax=Tropicimonas sp. TH_r6 TaxID=3082085 RepID=UPI0029535300|nr:tetratricopeptide repeat protein [Tropicimonas sp. TH_r6]MDV7142788.1 tetratricopeptide repeat protein [Tropicimonas sp. TH_r6]